jgi:hypothetical protein
MGARMIKLPFRISGDSLKETYNQVRSAMSNNEHIIFQAMNTITLGRRKPFIPPSDVNEYNQKHREIEEILAYPVAGRGIETAMCLMEEIVLMVRPSGGVPGYSTHDLLDRMRFRTTTPRTSIFLTDELHWAVRWDTHTHTAILEKPDKVFLDIYSNDMGEIVPSYLAKYVDYAILAYQEKINIVALALLSITIEATLRDVLANKGYSFDRGGSPMDIYGFARAEVGVSGNAYTLTFREPMPLSPTDFLSAHGGNSIEIEIRRNINANRNRVDLLVRDPRNLIDYWSTNIVVQSATRRVNGLGEALNIARNVERFINPRVLLEDFDEVISVIRNNLVHLSGDALNTPLPMFNYRSPTNTFTLQNFLEDDELVYDFVTNVPRFISGQYNDLRRVGP